MERINSNNYEAYFLDYMEGDLSAQQEFELMDYLDKNPNLKAELEGDFGDLKLVPAASIAFDKGSLKKVGIQPEEVNDMMIASVEEQLSVSETADLNSYVDQNNLGQSFKYYQNTLLQADLSIGYGDKADLKKKDRFVVPFWMKATAAAGVLALIIGVSINQMNNEASELTENVPVSVSENEMEPELITTDFNTVNSDHELDHGSEFSIIPEDLNADENLTGTIESVDDVIEDYKEIRPESSDLIIEDESNQNIDQNQIDTTNKIEPENIIDPEELIEPKEEIKSRDEYNKEKDEIIVEEPIKIITDFAGNILNKDISYERSKRSSNGEKVEHHIKFGKFEFQRKKH